MKKWNIEISDSAYYPGVEANSADEALLKAWEWFVEREPRIILTPVNEE